MDQDEANLGLQLISNSRLTSFKTCRRKHQFEYLIGVRKRPSDALRFGTSTHRALQLWYDGKPLDDIARAIYQWYEWVPDWADQRDWEVERETVVRLIFGYVWYWGLDLLPRCGVAANEIPFELPIRNPLTGRLSRIYRAAGMIDKIVVEDQRTVIYEHKTTGSSIAPDADFWRKLRLDQQVSMYFWAAGELEYDVEAVIYDVIRKPAISPFQATPPEKRKYKKDGSLYASCRENDETPVEFGERLSADIQERPDFYFARQEVPRLQSDITDFLYELWDQAKDLRFAEKAERHYRNTGACLAPYRCPYLDVCQAGFDLAEHLPEGFVQLGFRHPELEEHYATDQKPATATAAEAAGSP